LRRLTKAALVAILCFVALLAQEPPGRKAPSITMLPAPIAGITRGKPNPVELVFRVESGFHVNSNQPSAEYLIPTQLRLDPPTDIAIGKITYPPGQETSFAFAPDDKFSVYTGDFTLSVDVRPLSSVLPTKYEIHGNLRYQACDNAACYPPKNLPVRFEVNVLKAPRPPKKNPPQSPHAHS